jgi:hypothetical protein
MAGAQIGYTGRPTVHTTGLVYSLSHRFVSGVAGEAKEAGTTQWQEQEQRMFNVMISFKGSQNLWQLMFKKEDEARRIVDKFADGTAPIHIVDDFGTEAIIPLDCVAGILIEDMSRCGDAAIERTLYQARAQAQAQNKARNDPVLKLTASVAPQMPMNARPF